MVTIAIGFLIARTDLPKADTYEEPPGCASRSDGTARGFYLCGVRYAAHDCSVCPKDGADLNKGIWCLHDRACAALRLIYKEIPDEVAHELAGKFLEKYDDPWLRTSRGTTPTDTPTHGFRDIDVEKYAKPADIK